MVVTLSVPGGGGAGATMAGAAVVVVVWEVVCAAAVPVMRAQATMASAKLFFILVSRSHKRELASKGHM